MHTNRRHIQRAALLIAAIIGVVGALFFMRSFSGVTPEQVLSVLFDVSAPTRYAFISDADSNRVAVVDLLEGRQVSTLVLQGHPDFWALSATSGKLLYAEQGHDQIFLRDIAKHTHQQIHLPHAIKAWQYSDTHHWLFVAGDGYLSRIDISTGQVESVASSASSQQGIFYDAFLQKLWVIDGEGEALLAWALTDGQQASPVKRYPFTEKLRHFSPLAATPNRSYLMLGAENADNQYQFLLWDLPEAQWLHTDIVLGKEPMIRPYAGASGRYLWAFDEAGNGVRVDAAAPHLIRHIQTGIHTVRNIAVGWLDQHLLVTGQKTAALYNAESLQVIRSATLPARVEDLFITADSKHALLTVDGTTDLYLLSMRDGNLNRIPLDDLTHPEKVIMGASATLCH